MCVTIVGIFKAQESLFWLQWYVFNWNIIRMYIQYQGEIVKIKIRSSMRLPRYFWNNNSFVIFFINAVLKFQDKIVISRNV